MEFHKQNMEFQKRKTEFQKKKPTAVQTVGFKNLHSADMIFTGKSDGQQ